ncbi:MAG: Cof-type HAD-IIB family hydrolase [Chloroherpetonaceae bacterium]|nr:Cof-type HAD-IIB family hydrolase [Chthonomonadaceae bacterium]MDW8208301.1 Cof-type HAD-IIB family hydrolase [Chloroherpetonaceae bacterium]
MTSASVPYRLCALDLDETLLDSQHRISPRNMRAVRLLCEQGVTVVLASGRMHAAAVPFAHALQLDAPVISYNGAMVKHARTEEVWLHETIEPELANIVMDFCQMQGLQLNYYLGDRLYSARDTDWLRLYQGRTNAPVTVDPEIYVRFRSARPTKLIIVDRPEYTWELLDYFRGVFGDSLYITKSTDEYLEFMPPAANKGRALAVVAGRYGYRPEEVIAFGDSYNDIPMLQWAGMGVAVANAKDAVREVADLVVGRSADDGVGIALEELFGLSV